MLNFIGTMFKVMTGSIVAMVTALVFICGMCALGGRDPLRLFARILNPRQISISNHFLYALG